MFYRKPLPALLLATTALAGFGGPAIAQTNAPAQAAKPAEPINGEIIVTAQKRSESIQKVPISIQAITTEKLNQLNIANFNDYTKQLPSVTFQTIQPGSTSVYIRGVVSGGDGNHSGSLPSVGTYLDEQAITTIGGTLDVHVYDIERIEALSGPQGTLYGASSESGTIRIITNKPDTSHFYGKLDLEGNTVAHGSQGGKAEGFINAPINDRMAVRIVGFYEHDAGYIDNIPGTRTFIGAPDAASPGNSALGIPPGYDTGISVNNGKFVKKNYNDADIYGGRGALKIELNDNWTATGTVIGQQQSQHGSFGIDPSLSGLSVQHFKPEYDKDRFVQGALTIQGKIGDWDLTYAGAYLWRKINSSADYTDYAEAYDSLYSGSGGLANYFYYQDNAGNNIPPLQYIVGADTFRKLSQEVRISSPVDKPFRVVAGGFFQRQSHHIVQDYKIDGLGADLSVNGHPGTLWLTDQNRVDKDYAAFGEASYDIFHNLTLTGGLRYYKYDNSLIGFFGFGRNPNGPPYNAAGSSRTGVAACYNTDGSTVRENPGGTLAPPAQGLGPCTNLADFSNGKLSPKSTSGDGVIHRLNLTWKVTPDKMVYATWSRGFRPGGINRRADLPPYQPDFLTNYELGFKTSWLDHKLRVNGAFFWQDWKDFQYAFLGLNSFTEIHNGPDARIKGVEMDFSLYPVRGLTLSGSAAYIDGKTRKNLCAYDDPTFQCETPGPDGQVNFIESAKGKRMPVTPRFKMNALARYEFQLDPVKMHIQANVTHASSAGTDLRSKVLKAGVDGTDPAVIADPDSFFYPDQVGRIGAYTTADFALGGEWGNMSAEFFVENAFDARAQISRFQECGSCFQRPYEVIITPRTMGIRAGYKF
jgi:outer membrane receptor protein involved in Fe transport